MADFQTGMRTGMRQTFTVKTLVMVLLAFVGFAIARLLQEHALGRIAVLARVPEVSDIVVMLVAGGFIRGDNGTAIVIGAGLSLLNRLGARFAIPWLRIR